EQRTDYNEPSYLYPPEFTQFVCENCHIKSQKLQGGKSSALDRIEREIRRRLRTGEWKKSVGAKPVVAAKGRDRPSADSG
ncbi:MAG: hypothetical protein ACYTEX_26995, partial [Planctomycetota bacterium]